MPKAKDLTGYRFGRLLVISKAPTHIYPSGRTRTRWNCRCDCGTKKTVLSNVLAQGDARSCGCLRIKHGRSRDKDYVRQKSKDHYKKNKEKTTARQKERYLEKKEEILKWNKQYYSKIGPRIKVLARRLKTYSTKKNLPFNITEEYLLELWGEQNGECAITGLPLSLKRGCFLFIFLVVVLTLLSNVIFVSTSAVFYS